ncbi:RNA methyltransferase [Granulicella sp. WH15]|uniref:TrmH family RNA methyltransferase n=1 Tax=Granulicella sp. WH15 TaxID=2602070 RepID=UPI001367543B|nr:RNA methyltransferase [Granulicella sp. WH15]QHN03359.1 RNA methyltransferase [Granulicella sp. WH15]
MGFTQSGEQAVVTSRSNARVKQLRAAFAGQARLSSGLVAIEGEHLLEEALRSGQVLKTVFVSERRETPSWVPRGVEVIRLAGDVFASCVETQTPQGIAALLVPPTASVEAMLVGTPLILIAVGLQDPGNLGTLIRSAEAFGATGVMTSPGTVSPWNQKAIRASAGSVFRMPLAVAGSEEMKLLEAHAVRLFAAMPEDAKDAGSTDLTGPAALLIGNEGAGLGEGWVSMADARITIPCPGRVESLNAAVAGSLLLYEASRQRRVL